MKHLHTPWFYKVRGSYLPKSWQGWLLYIPYTAYIVGAAVYVYSRGDSLWGALFTLVPNWVAALAIMTWVAERTSKAV